MSVELGTDVCEDILRHGSNFDIINVASSSSLLQLEDSLCDETELFSMTSLGTLVFLEQRESKQNLNNSFGNNNGDCFAEDDKRLTLAYEKLTYIPRVVIERFSQIIHTLDISHNNFSNLDFLKEFKYLTTLIIDHNEITSDTVIPHMPKLELFWLNHCKIGELYPWGRKLQYACPNLRQLSLMGNPAAPSYLNGGSFQEYLQYRLFIISLFPKLVHLDDRAVTVTQREEAERLYRRPFFERLAPCTVQSLPPYLRVVTDAATNLFNNSPFQDHHLKNSII